MAKSEWRMAKYAGEASLCSLLVVLCFALPVPSARAVTFVQGASLSSTNFRILDSQHAGFKASSSSDSYRLLSTIGDVAIGSSSGTTYGLRSGFLYFPLVIAPALTDADAGNGEVDVTWDAAEMDGGWTVGGYNVCFKETPQPDSAYDCTSFQVGPGTLSETVTGLSNGTSYTFKVQAKESSSFAQVIAESGTLAATPAGGGGGGGGGSIITRGVDIEGFAYPDATVRVLRDGVVIGTVSADGDGEFDYRNTSIGSGTYIFGFRATDADGRVSGIMNVPVTIGSTLVNIRNVIIAPTVALTGTNSVSPGTPIGVTGYSAADAQVRIRIAPPGTEYVVVADVDGRYSFSIPTTGLANGTYNVSARTELLPGVGTSGYSQPITVGIGVAVPVGCGNPPDINRDGRVNLVDFSIMAFWWKRLPLPSARPFDLNCDGQVRLDDFSILAYHWSG